MECTPGSPPDRTEDTRANEFQLILTMGPEAAERATYALQAAVMAVCTESRVTVHLVLASTYWTCRNHELSPEAAEVVQLLERLMELGGNVECCSSCASEKCLPRDGEVLEAALRDGIRMAGISSWMERAAHGAKTVTF